jgi:hypothetical protein
MALTGENFLRIDRHNSTINNLKGKINKVKNEFDSYMRVQYNKEMGYIDGEPDTDIFVKCHKFEKRIERLEYLLYCAEYEENRRRNWN